MGKDEDYAFFHIHTHIVNASASYVQRVQFPDDLQLAVTSRVDELTELLRSVGSVHFHSP